MTIKVAERLRRAVSTAQSAGPVAGLLAVSIFASYALSDVKDPYWSSVGVNLFSGFIAAATTIYGIDALSTWRKKRERFPVRAACYEDVRLIVARGLSLWRDAYVYSVGDSEPSSWEQLLSRDSMCKLETHFDIFRNAHVLPPRPWWHWFDEEFGNLRSFSGRALERHSTALEPQVLQDVHLINYHSRSDLGSLHSSGKVRPGIRITGGLIVGRPWLDALVRLHDWTLSEHLALISARVQNIHEPFYFVPLETGCPLEARFDDATALPRVRYPGFGPWHFGS